MKQILIACSMMEDEIKKVYQEIDCQVPIVWVERGFHNTPQRLKEELQRIIDHHQDYDEILLTFGLCGNGVEGIISPKTVLVLPKFDDCINMLLCTKKRESRGLTEPGSIYLTRGWTLDSESVLKQYETYVESFGEESAEGILEMMYEHYEKISVIDTGSYDMDSVMEYAKKTSDLLGLSTDVKKGSTHILKQLLSGQWEENFIVQRPGDAVRQSYFEFSKPSETEFYY